MFIRNFQNRYLSRAQLKRTVLWIGAGAWILATSALVTVLHSRHVFGFQTTNPANSKGWLKEQIASSGPSLKIIHFLSMDCGCSAQVAEALIGRQSSDSLNSVSAVSPEIAVLLVSPESSSQMKKAEDLSRAMTLAGYEARILDETGDLPVQGVPALMAARGGQAVYLGGYLKTRVTKASDLVVETLIAEIESSGSAKVRPIFGCSTSKYVRKIQKPESWFGLLTGNL